MIKNTFILLFLFLSNNLLSQNVFSGKIIDANTHKPIAGATILEAAKTNGTYSDSLGIFKLTTKNRHPTFTVSHVGYVNFEYKGGKKKNNDIVIPMTKAVYDLGELKIKNIEAIENLLKTLKCNPNKNNERLGEDFVIVESFCNYPGGFSCLDSLFLANLYKDILDKSLLPFGTVDVYFTVNKQGFLENITVNREIPTALLDDLNRAFKAMSRWKPATQRGQNISINCVYRIEYK